MIDNAVLGTNSNVWFKVALEEKIERMQEADTLNRKQKPKLVAFGRTLPINLRWPKPADEPEEYKPVFPEEIKTREVVFHGINHLR